MPPRPLARWVLLIWGCFLVRLWFYASILPLWEGYDETGHFAVIRVMALQGKLLVARDHPVSRDMELCFALAPIPWSLNYLPPPSVTQDVFWALPPEDQARREAAFRTIPHDWAAQDSRPDLTAYEGLQAPLYYWLMAPVLRLASGWTLASQVMLIRWLSALIASLAIPLVFQAAWLVFGDDKTALATTAVVAVMPGFAMDVARVGNDCLAVVWLTLLTVLVLKPPRRWWLTGIVLGLGLLTKAYFLTAFAALILLLRRRSLPMLAIAAAISGWWYVRNLVTTGTLSGLSEAVMIRGTGFGTLLGQAFELPWLKAIDAILFSHLYWGGWSSLPVRSWMYHVFYVAIAVAAIGLARVLRRPPIQALAAIYAAFWLGQCYNVLLLYASKGLPGSMGWYMYAVIGAEAVLCVAGLRAILPGRLRPWAAPAGAALFSLLDLYTLHAVAIPYYTGIIRHRPNGTLAAFHASDFAAVGWGGAATRLAEFKPFSPVVIVALWIVYLLATLVLVAVGFRAASMSSLDKELL